MQLARLGGSATLYTALGADALGRRAAKELAELGVRVEAVFRDEPQRRAFTFIDADGERTITVIGARMAPTRPTACRSTSSRSTTLCTSPAVTPAR